MPRIDIYDTTLRDGAQGEGVDFSLQDKLDIAHKLDECGVDFIEGGYPLSNPKDEAFFREMSRTQLKHALVAAFGMTRRRGVTAAEDIGMQALIASQAPVITLVGKTWDMHVREVLRVDLDENLAMIRDSVAFCRAQGRRVFYDAEHCFDGLKHNREYGLRTLETAAKAGAEVLVLCDTNGGSMPEWIAEAIDLIRSRVDCALGIHCHNDGDLATANTLAAVDHGCIQVQGTINGIGERCGNTDIIPVVGNLALKRGYQVLPEGALARLTDLSRFVYQTANLIPRNGQPYVGQSAFAHKGGMHVHAMERNPVTYEHIDPTLVGNQRKFLMSELAGRSNVRAMGRHQLSDAEQKKVLEAVQNLENEGYQFESATGSFDLLVRRELGLFQEHFVTMHYQVTVVDDIDHKQEEPRTEATVKLRVGDKVRHEVAEGDGPVNALDAAMRKALEHDFPQLKPMRLTDYKVRVVNPRAGTAAKVRVIIQSTDGVESWGTVGVHENIIHASWSALADAFEYTIQRAAERG